VYSTRGECPLNKALLLTLSCQLCYACMKVKQDWRPHNEPGGYAYVPSEEDQLQPPTAVLTLARSVRRCERGRAGAHNPLQDVRRRAADGAGKMSVVLPVAGHLALLKDPEDRATCGTSPAHKRISTRRLLLTVSDQSCYGCLKLRTEGCLMTCLRRSAYQPSEEELKWMESEA